MAGLLLLACLWLGPLAEMARRAFSPHMILHLGVMVVAAPLIAVGLLRLSPPDLAPRHRYLGAFAASVLDFAVVWGWHVPALHEAAARLTHVFAIQQVSFLTAGLSIWWVCLAGHDEKSDAAGAFAMLFASMHMAMLGVLFVLARSLVYGPQFCLGAFGLDPLSDQQFGGGIMALFGSLAYVAGGAYLGLRLAGQKT